jgi:hypothetical protein
MIRHTKACQDQWSMEIQVCVCGASDANREIATKDAEIRRLRAENAKMREAISDHLETI